MNDRLAFFLKIKNLSASRFAEMMEIQPSSISHILSGRNKPGCDFIVKFLEKFPDVNPLWFMLGKGEMNGGQAVAIPDKSSVQQLNFDLLPKVNKQLSQKSVEKIVVFYNDKTFAAYESE